MTDPTPVPLDEIEAAAEATDDYPHGSPGPWTVIPEGSVSPPAVWSSAARDFVAADLTTIDAAFIAAADPPTVLALCKALRKAVEGLAVASCVSCERPSHPSADCRDIADFAPSAYQPCTACRARDSAVAALAAVRELVDLGRHTDD